MGLLKLSPKVPEASLLPDWQSLRDVALFAKLHHSEVALRALAQLMHEVEFAPEQAIITEGESGAEMFILLEGQVGIFKQTPQGDRYKVADLGGAKGVFFGEGALLDEEARSASIHSNSKCRCLVLDRNSFSAFSQAHPEWALPIVQNIARLVNGRLRKTNQDLLLLYNALVAEIQGS